MKNLNTFIKQVLLSFEQSSTSIKYNKIYKFNDGPKNIKQLTLSFGITEYGNLKRFIQKYIDSDGTYSDSFKEFIDLIGKVPIVDNKDFNDLLIKSADDVVMQQCQEQAFEEYYILPSYKWCDENQFLLPLSKLVIADSFLQSGSILKLLRNKFSESTPKNKGNEKIWIEEYCKARQSWLSSFSLQALRNSSYRPKFMLDLIQKDDWNLTQNAYNANGVKIVEK